MIRFIWIFLFTICAVPYTQAQVVERSVGMSAGVQNALVLEVPAVDAGLVSDLWKDYMKDFYREKPKWQRKDKEWLSDDADIAALGMGNTVDVIAKTEQKGDDTFIYMWIDLGGAYLNSRQHRERYTKAEKMLVRFGLEVARAKVKIELEEQEDMLKDLNRDLERLATDKERYEREIQRARETIAKAEQDIEDNLKAQEEMAARIKAQEDVIKSVQKRLNDL
jgi:outer membrane murein-binding lipoprotein Lpp